MGDTQRFGQFAAQGIHAVAQAARAELSEIGQILAKLGRLDPRRLGQRRTRNGIDLIGLQPLQRALNSRSPI